MSSSRLLHLLDNLPCRPPSGAFFAIRRRFRDRKGKKATGENDGAEEAVAADMLATFAVESHVENVDAPDSLRCIRAFMPDSNTLAAFIPAPHNPLQTGKERRNQRGAPGTGTARALFRGPGLCVYHK